MPLYEYECEACGSRFEVIQRFADAPIAVCRKCGGGPVQRLASAPAIQFKGTGWYITDYARKGAGGETSTISSNGSNGNGNGAGPSSTKKDTTTESKPATTEKTEKTGTGNASK
ncbi:MAG TPA: zinc ribbon domain-containing protein [Vicinamibacterales bacterium]|nr:zinc ribbon domain-containing protein [Vicinamibacterales bacterium]